MVTCSSPSPDSRYTEETGGYFIHGIKNLKWSVYDQVELGSTYPLYKSTTDYDNTPHPLSSTMMGVQIGKILRKAEIFTL